MDSRQLRIELCRSLGDIPLECLNDIEDIVKLGLEVIVLEIYGKCQRDHIVNVQILLFAVCLHVEEQLVFRRQSMMSFNMVNELLVAELAEALVIDSI